MACMANISTIVVTKTGVWSTFDGDVSGAELVLVYLGKSMLQDTVPIPPNQNPSPLTRMCMNTKMLLKIQIGALQGPWVMGKPLHHPPPLPTESEPVLSKRRQKHRKRKPRIKIIKERVFKIRR